MSEIERIDNPIEARMLDLSKFDISNEELEQAQAYVDYQAALGNHIKLTTSEKMEIREREASKAWDRGYFAGMIVSGGALIIGAIVGAIIDSVTESRAEKKRRK